MKSETFEKDLKSKLNGWRGKDTKLLREAGRVPTGNTIPAEKSDFGAPVFTYDQNRAVDIMQDDPLFVKESPIDIWGAWRRVYHCNGWWVVGHYMLYPCNSEREADRVCSKLQAEWEET